MNVNKCKHCGTRTGIHGFSFEYNEEEQEQEQEFGPPVCVSHLRFLPCRARSGCVISIEPHAVNIVRLFQQNHITKKEAYIRLEDW